MNEDAPCLWMNWRVDMMESRSRKEKKRKQMKDKDKLKPKQQSVSHLSVNKRRQAVKSSVTTLKVLGKCIGWQIFALHFPITKFGS
jgi:hypothetical protein